MPIALLAVAAVVFVAAWQLVDHLYAKRLSALQTTISYQDDLISDYRARALSGGDPIVGALISLTAFQVKPPSDGNRFRLNIYFVNSGNLAARAPYVNAELMVADARLPQSAEDAQIKRLSDEITFLNPQTTGKMFDPGGQLFITRYDDDVTPEVYSKIISGDKVIYYFIIYKYQDASLSPTTVKVSEYCGWFRRDFGHWQLCDAHNRTFVTHLTQ